MDDILNIYGSAIQQAQPRYMKKLIGELNYYINLINEKLEHGEGDILISPEDEHALDRKAAMELRDKLAAINDGYAYICKKVWECEEFINRLRHHYQYIVHPTYVFGLFGGVPDKHKAMSTPRKSFTQRALELTGLKKPQMPTLATVREYATKHHFQQLTSKSLRGELPPPNLSKVNPVSLFAPSHDDEDSEAMLNIPAKPRQSRVAPAKKGAVQRDIQTLASFRNETDEAYKKVMNFVQSEERSKGRWKKFLVLLEEFKQIVPEGFVPGTVAKVYDQQAGKLQAIKGSNSVKIDNLSEPVIFYNYRYKKLLAIKSTDLLQ
jgi:hypothetical protein